MCNLSNIYRIDMHAGKFNRSTTEYTVRFLFHPILVVAHIFKNRNDKMG